MLIGFSLENVSSFKDTQNLSMETSALQKDDFLPQNTIEVENGTNLLKSALIYGANASGKTNLINVIEWFKSIILSPKEDISSNEIRRVIPFILDSENLKKPSEFEIIFIENNIKYRYGLSLFEGVILEEWLYYTKNRETLLFHRKKQEIEYNKTAFKEAELFIKQSKDSNQNMVDRTAPHIPLISVLSFTDGSHSKNVTNFFKRVQSISGINDEQVANYTFQLAQKDKDFYNWILDILKDFHITDLIIGEEEINHKIEFSLNNNGETIELGGIGLKKFNIRVKKNMSHSEEKVEIPLELESSGTKKIIHLLGPIYDSIKKGNILFIDEFDSKFHTLLSKHIFKLFHQYDKNSQLIVNVQDTNLMDTDDFRRDQIWFVHKDSIIQDSRLYSLAEYKIAIQESYGKDYLNGSFEAIPLFSSPEDVNNLMECK